MAGANVHEPVLRLVSSVTEARYMSTGQRSGHEFSDATTSFTYLATRPNCKQPSSQASASKLPAHTAARRATQIVAPSVP